MKAGIAGAGVMGRLLAAALVNAGWEVSLFDSRKTADELNCSMAAAGLLTPVTELAKCDTLIYHLGMQAIQTHLPRLIEQLNGVVDRAIFFKIQGSLVLAHPKDTAELQLLIDLLQYKKLEAKSIYSRLNNEQIRTLEPQLNQWDNAYYFHDEGNLDNQAFLTALALFLKAHAVKWRMQTQVEDVKPGKIILENAVETFDLVCDCRGLGANSNFADLRGIRGELLWLYAPEVSITRPLRLMHPRYNLYIAPRPNSIYILGASEIESADDSPISVRTVLELLSAAYYVHSGFAEARLIKSVTQVRPTLADHLPKIKHAPGFVAINGLYRHGFLLSPTLMQEVMQWLQFGIDAVSFPEIWEALDD